MLKRRHADPPVGDIFGSAIIAPLSYVTGASFLVHSIHRFQLVRRSSGLNFAFCVFISTSFSLLEALTGTFICSAGRFDWNHHPNCRGELHHDDYRPHHPSQSINSVQRNFCLRVARVWVMALFQLLSRICSRKLCGKKRTQCRKLIGGSCTLWLSHL